MLRAMQLGTYLLQFVAGVEDYWGQQEVEEQGMFKCLG
jgi:hypothetical protein